MDKEEIERQDWSVTIKPSSVGGLAVGATLEVAVTLSPLDGVERGASQPVSYTHLTLPTILLV